MHTAVQRRDDLSYRDQLVYAAHWALNWARIGTMGLRRGRAMLGELERQPWLWVLTNANNLLDIVTRGRRGAYREACAALIDEVIAGIVDSIEGFFYEPERVVLHEDLVPPEILYGMGLQPWMAEFLGIVIPMLAPESIEHYIDVAENEGIPADICSLPKSTLGLALAGHLPPVAAIVTSNMPCDGGMSQYALIEREMRAPAFRLDVPHQFYNERAVDYFAAQLEELIAWLEEKTPGKMDWDRLRQVCEERNRAWELELELWDLLRARPAPLAAETVYLSHLMYGIAQPGTPRATRTFRRMVRFARENLQKGKGALDNERYRAALWNPPTLICLDLFAWAEQTYGVSLIMDMLSYNRHPFVDTTSPQTMLRDLARIIMQGPMARHTRGPAENFFSDLFHFYELFELDMIWMAAHIGCKNTQALLGMFREKCRERGIPLFLIDYDLSDTRIVSPDAIRRQAAQFMETVMQATPLG